MTVPTFAAAATQQPAGSVRGIVYDKDFEVPLAFVQVTAVETGQKMLTNDQGNFVFQQIPPGKYTLVFTKEGYVRQVKSEVVVLAGQLTEIDVWLSGEFTDMEELLVQDILQLEAGSEAALLSLRFDSAALMDSIGSELMSRSGASDAASALRLVSGASIQDGKFAVIRGLPDRYVSSQLNNVRLPTADENKRAVELDQFPAAVIESIQVSKTFTPDQQGDASGGAVNLKLKGIPEEATLILKAQYGFNSNVGSRSDFLTYDGGGLDLFGTDDGGRDIQYENLGGNWTGAAGVSEGDAPIDSKWALSWGDNHSFDNGVKIGGFVSLFYERDSSYIDDGKNDKYWVTNPGDPMTPHTFQGTPSDGDFKTALFDITQGKQSVTWGGLGTFGVETEDHSLALTYFYSHSAEDSATLATDTRGKEYYFPNYNPNDPVGPGNEPSNLSVAPYLRLETLAYTERTTNTLQLNGTHKMPFGAGNIGENFDFRAPEFDWIVSHNQSNLYQPDKRQFGALWLPASYNPGAPPFIPPFTSPETWLPYKPAANFNLGNFQRIWKEIDESSDQASLNLKWPFQQWTGTDGYAKVGWFADQVTRRFNQDTFSNFGDAGASYLGGWDDPWSEHFPSEDHPITASTSDVDYQGDQDINAFYWMMDMPLSETVNLVGGIRRESTHIGIVNDPEADAVWFPPGSSAPVALGPGDADVTYERDDLLPSIGIDVRPTEGLNVRLAYSQTVARQTFKELTPILQQEFLGGPIFIGNPDLTMSSLKNYDLRADFAPAEGALVSASYFSKSIDDPIETVQRVVSFDYTTPVNYPKGRLDGYEMEFRQRLGSWWDSMKGVSVGVNATFLSSEVTLPDEDSAVFDDPGIAAPMDSRDMTNTPDHLYNAYITYDIEATRTQLSLFYTVQGDTLVAGATESNGNFIPSVYATEYDTLNFGVAQSLGKYVKLQFQAKNLTDPEIQEVYRSKYIGDDVTKTSYTKGIDYSLSLTANFSL